jgi:hypothetical protein
MHDDEPQVIVPAPEASGRVAARLREAQAILAESRFSGGRVEEEEGPTLLIRLAPADLPRLQDDAARNALVARFKSLGYAFVALDITPDGTLGAPPVAAPDGGSAS